MLIGPADYLLLSRFSLPRHLTWLTFFLVAAAVIAVAAGMGRQVHGSRVRMNQAEVIDIDLQQQVARGTVWCHLYSPTTRQFDARLEVDNSRRRRRWPAPRLACLAGIAGRCAGRTRIATAGARQPRAIHRFDAGRAAGDRWPDGASGLVEEPVSCVVGEGGDAGRQQADDRPLRNVGGRIQFHQFARYH